MVLIDTTASVAGVQDNTRFRFRLRPVFSAPRPRLLHVSHTCVPRASRITKPPDVDVLAKRTENPTAVRGHRRAGARLT